MAEFAIEFNPEQMIGKLNDLQKLVIPKAAEMALNETAFAIREQMKQEIKDIFYKPVAYSRRTLVYRKINFHFNGSHVHHVTFLAKLRGLVFIPHLTEFPVLWLVETGH